VTRANVFYRGLLTNALVDHLTAALTGKLLVGDGIAPENGGWAGGQAGSGEFVAYIVLSGRTATPWNAEPIRGGQGSWRATYSVLYAGGDRQQADWSGDTSREAVQSFAGTRLDLNGQWGVLNVEHELIGPLTRNDQVNPPYWEATDSIVLSLEVGR
jgi:hypothetical protein